jgi:hypothetical protein
MPTEPDLRLLELERQLTALGHLLDAGVSAAKLAEIEAADPATARDAVAFLRTRAQEMIADLEQLQRQAPADSPIWKQLGIRAAEVPRIVESLRALCAHVSAPAADGQPDRTGGQRSQRPS